MPFSVTSPNMGIVVPVPLIDTGPDWATKIYAALYTTIDAHNHAPGNGALVPTAGLDIDADLSFEGFNALAIRSSQHASQSSTLALPTDVGCLYNVLGDAYWNNASGTPIRLTQNGAVAATFSNWSAKLAVTGNFTILSTDAYELYFVSLSSGVATGNLPASSSLTPGRLYIFSDWQQASETHALTIVPNGTDTINGSNSSYTFQQNGGELTLYTDGAGHWVATVTGLPYVKSTGLSFTGSLALVGSTGLSATATAGNLSLTSTAGNVVLNAVATSQLVQLQHNGIDVLQISSSGLGIGGTPILALSGATLQHLQQIVNWTGGTGRLQSNGTDVCSIVAAGLAIGGTSAPTLTSGTGAPSSTPPNGSLYLRTDGGSSPFAIYTRQGGAWSNIASGLTAIVAETQRTVTSSYTVDSSGNDYEILCNFSAPGTITLPAPTASRVLKVSDISFSAQTNVITLAQHASEKIGGVAASRVCQTNGGSWTLTSNGTDWFLS